MPSKRSNAMSFGKFGWQGGVWWILGVGWEFYIGVQCVGVGFWGDGMLKYITVNV